MKFQAEVRDYVDQSISSTINLPAWGSKLNNEDTVPEFAETLAKYAPKLRGFTCYPDGSRGGQSLTSVPYSEAVEKLGEEFDEHVETHDICNISGTSGTCGVLRKRLGINPASFVWRKKPECWFPVEGQDAHSKCSQ